MLFKTGDVVRFNNETYKVKRSFLCEGEIRYIIVTLDGRSEISSVSSKGLIYDKGYYRKQKLNKIVNRIK
jgi:hypothetical protein